MKGVLLAIASAVLTATIGPIVKLIDADPLSVSALRMIFAFLFLLAAYPFCKDRIFKVTKRQIFDYFIIGLVMAAAFTLWVVAFKYAPVSNVILIGSSQAVFAAVFGYFFLREKISKSELVSLLVAIAGFAIINPFEADFIVGNLLAIANSVLFGFLIVFMKMRSKGHSYLSLLWAFFFASILLSPFLFLESYGNLIRFIPKIAFLGIFSTGIAYLALISSLKYLKAELSSLVLLIGNPIAGILLSVALLGEVLLPRIIIGGLFLITAGVVLLKGKPLHPA